jgi:glutamate racemase
MPQAEVFGQACPLFVPLVEEGLWEDPVTDEIARRYMASLLDSRIDTLIMGCTHYPLIRRTIGRAAGENVALINPAYETAMELRRMLTSMDLLSTHRQELGSGEPQYRFYVSDMAGQFRQFANSIIKYGILAAEKIDIHNYSGAPLREEESGSRSDADAPLREEESGNRSDADAPLRGEEAGL